MIYKAPTSIMNQVDVQLNSTMHLISGNLRSTPSHGFQCSPTLNHHPYEGRLPLTTGGENRQT